MELGGMYDPQSTMNLIASHVACFCLETWLFVWMFRIVPDVLVVYIIVAVTITSRQSYPHSCWWKECSTNQRIASIYKEYEPWNLSAFLHIPTIWGYRKPEDNHDGLWQSSFSRANQMEFLSCVRRKLLQNPRSGFMDWTWIPRCKSEKRQCDLAFACQC